MSKIHYSSRPYSSGDEDSINDLYFKITGHRRTREQWAWQWQRAPGGAGDIWLIEANHADGRVELIGHHGIMPVRFTWREKDLLFGKTENTMVLPEYRRKILYPRYERKFAAQYESRYHALLSTLGPVPAMRQRKAMGYTANHPWIYWEYSSRFLGELAFLLVRTRGKVSDVLLKAMVNPKKYSQTRSEVQLLTSNEARRESYFYDYWKRARNNWGVAPRRDAEDLTWRYWDNPYSEHFAIVVRHPKYGDAFFVIESYRQGAVEIADFSMQSPSMRLFEFAWLNAVDVIKRKFDAKLITTLYTGDALPSKLSISWEAKRRTALMSRMRGTRKKFAGHHMPRKVTENGSAIGLPLHPWNITLIVSEGRR